MSYAILYGIDPDSLDVDYSSVAGVEKDISREISYSFEDEDANDAMKNIESSLSNLTDLRDVSENVSSLVSEFDSQVEQTLSSAEHYLNLSVVEIDPVLKDLYEQFSLKLYEQIPHSIYSTADLEKHLSPVIPWLFKYPTLYLSYARSAIDFAYTTPSQPDTTFIITHGRRWTGNVEIRKATLEFKGKAVTKVVEKLEQQGYNPMNLSREDLIVLEMLDKQNIEIYNLLYSRAQQDLK